MKLNLVAAGVKKQNKFIHSKQLLRREPLVFVSSIKITESKTQILTTGLILITETRLHFQLMKLDTGCISVMQKETRKCLMNFIINVCMENLPLE